jgi:hypothetical protein
MEFITETSRFCPVVWEAASDMKRRNKEKEKERTQEGRVKVVFQMGWKV